MPRTRVGFYREPDGSVPTLDWLDNVVGLRDQRAKTKCRVKLDILAEFGSDLRRPLADLLRDGIHELRVDFGGVHFFVGQTTVVVSHGIVKEARVSEREIELAVRRRRLWQSDPERHTHYEA